MSDLRTAAQQALNALSCIEYGMCGITEGPSDDTTMAAMDALRAALAQPKGGGNLPPPLQAEPVQEPVAWLVMDESGYVQHAASWRDAAHEHINDAINEHDLVCARTWRVVPVYTAPPQRKPLSLTDLQEALVLTNLIDRDAIDDSEEYDEGSTLAQIDELYRIIKE